MIGKVVATRTLTILGSTGSIGTNTLDVVGQNPDRFRVFALAAGRNVDLLAQQIQRFKPTVVVLQDAGDVLQPARTNSIGAFLILLDLLKCQAERVAKFLLTHRQHHSPHANAATHVAIDRIRGFLRHLSCFFFIWHGFLLFLFHFYFLYRTLITSRIGNFRHVRTADIRSPMSQARNTRAGDIDRGRQL